MTSSVRAFIACALVLSAGDQVGGVAFPQVIENPYMKVTVPDGWTAGPAFRRSCATVKFGANCSPTAEPIPGAMQITKGNYVLFIDPRTTHASGIDGGRFSEIALGLTSVDAVFAEGEVSPCGTSEKHGVDSSRFRVDYYVNNSTVQQWCRAPNNDKTVWYMSHITTPAGGYFNVYQNHIGADDNSWVITMSHLAHEVNALPDKGSAALNAALSEMTEIVKTLQLKRNQAK